MGPLVATAQLDVSTCSDLQRVISNITNAAGFIALLAAVIVILIAAYNFIFGGGSEDAAKTGRRYLVFALAGIALALAAFTLPNLIVRILGARIPNCP